MAQEFSDNSEHHKSTQQEASEYTWGSSRWQRYKDPDSGRIWWHCIETDNYFFEDGEWNAEGDSTVHLEDLAKNDENSTSNKSEAVSMSLVPVDQNHGKEASCWNDCRAIPKNEQINSKFQYHDVLGAPVHTLTTELLNVLRQLALHLLERHFLFKVTKEEVELVPSTQLLPFLSRTIRCRPFDCWAMLIRRLQSKKGGGLSYMWHCYCYEDLRSDYNLKNKTVDQLIRFVGLVLLRSPHSITYLGRRAQLYEIEIAILDLAQKLSETNSATNWTMPVLQEKDVGNNWQSWKCMSQWDSCTTHTSTNKDESYDTLLIPKWGGTSKDLQLTEVAKVENVDKASFGESTKSTATPPLSWSCEGPSASDQLFRLKDAAYDVGLAAQLMGRAGQRLSNAVRALEVVVANGKENVV